MKYIKLLIVELSLMVSLWIGLGYLAGFILQSIDAGNISGVLSIVVCTVVWFFLAIQIPSVAALVASCLKR